MTVSVVRRVQPANIRISAPPLSCQHSQCRAPAVSNTPTHSHSDLLGLSWWGSVLTWVLWVFILVTRYSQWEWEREREREDYLISPHSSIDLNQANWSGDGGRQHSNIYFSSKQKPASITVCNLSKSLIVLRTNNYGLCQLLVGSQLHTNQIQKSILALCHCLSSTYNFFHKYSIQTAQLTRIFLLKFLLTGPSPVLWMFDIVSDDCRAVLWVTIIQRTLYLISTMREREGDGEIDISYICFIELYLIELVISNQYRY